MVAKEFFFMNLAYKVYSFSGLFAIVLNVQLKIFDMSYCKAPSKCLFTWFVMKTKQFLFKNLF